MPLGRLSPSDRVDSLIVTVAVVPAAGRLIPGNVGSRGFVSGVANFRVENASNGGTGRFPCGRWRKTPASARPIDHAPTEQRAINDEDEFRNLRRVSTTGPPLAKMPHALLSHPRFDWNTYEGIAYRRAFGP